jgi:hypothetical protein
MKYLNGTRELVLTLGVDDLTVINWYVDASFAVHPDYRSHTGAVMTYGTGSIQALSRKQKLNTRSSTEAELVGVDDALNQVLWTKLFLEDQGYPVKENILHQDNKSSILLEENGKKSSSKRTRAINIRYFFVTDQVKKGNLTIKYCPTDLMIGNFMTKPLQGKKFMYFRNLILGIPFEDEDANGRSVLEVSDSSGISDIRVQDSTQDTLVKDENVLEPVKQMVTEMDVLKCSSGQNQSWLKPNVAGVHPVEPGAKTHGPGSILTSSELTLLV